MRQPPSLRFSLQGDLPVNHRSCLKESLNAIPEPNNQFKVPGAKHAVLDFCIYTSRSWEGTFYLDEVGHTVAIAIVLYMVEVGPSIEVGNRIDKEGGPGAVFAKLVERFHPQSMWGVPTRRGIFMVVELNSPVEVAELMYVLTWFTGKEPKITEIMPANTYDEAMNRAKKIVSPS